MSGRSKAKATRAVPRVLFLVALTSLSALGCATIIGLDDYRVASNAGSGGVTNSAGKGGGVAGKAGANAAGTAGTAGSADNAGEGNEAGATNPGEGGSAGSMEVPQIVGCDGTTPFEPNEAIVRSCLLRAGCDPTFAPVRTISTCVTFDTQDALKGESCNLKSKTCDDYEQCEHIGVAHADLCGTKGTRCEGDTAINCGNYAGDDRFFDCAALGGTCDTLLYSDTAHTLYADCKLDVAPDSCVGQPDTDTAYYCHSAAGQTDSRYYCWDDKAFGASCSSFATCSDTPPEGSGGGAPTTGNAGCFFDTESCTKPAAPTCTNNVATVCSQGALFKYDCGAVGLDCAVTADSEYCLAPGCKPEDVDTNCQESCSDDGSQLTFCYGGQPYTVTCTDYGFTQCLSDTDSSTGLPYAACRF